MDGVKQPAAGASPVANNNKITEEDRPVLDNINNMAAKPGGGKTYRELVTASSQWALTAYEMGWTPFPLSKTGKAKNGVIGCKAVLVKDWTTKDVTREEVETYVKPGVGLRMGAQRDGTVVAALDFDIPPADTAQRALELFEDFIGPDRATQALIRFGRAAKFCVLVRTDEASQSTRSPFYDRGEDEARLEVFASHSNQIGAQGIHSVDADTDEPAVMYGWADDVDPSVTAPADLPMITKKEIETFIALLHDVMLEQGWTKRLMYEGAGSEGGAQYDLPPDVEAIALDMDNGERMRMREIIGPVEGDSDKRGIVRHFGDGRLGVWDRNTSVMHMPARFDPDNAESPADNFARFQQKMLDVVGLERLQALTGGAEAAEINLLRDRETWRIDIGCEGLGGWDRMQKMVRNLQAKFAHFPGGKGDEEIINVFTGSGSNRKRLTTAFDRHNMELEIGETYVQGARAGEPKMKLVNPLDQLLKAEGTRVIGGYQYVPGCEDALVPFVDANGGSHADDMRLNLYRAPRYRVKPEDRLDADEVGQKFERYVRHLVVEEGGADWLLNWIAHKTQHPAERGASPALVTPKQGTGRNILFKMLSGVLGGGNVGDVKAKRLFGGSQSDFHDVLLNRALITCDEVLVDPEASFAKRAMMTETLKSLVDPAPQFRTWSRKGLSDIDGWDYTSYIWASNHPANALPLPAGDRRFAVWQCTEVAMTDAPADVQEFKDWLVPLGGPFNEAGFDALRRYLLARETSRKEFAFAPLSDTKERVIEAGRSEIDEVIDAFMATQLEPGQLCFRVKDMISWCEGRLSDRPMARLKVRDVVRSRALAGFNDERGVRWWLPNKDGKLRVHAEAGATPIKGVVVAREGIASSSFEDRRRWLMITDEPGEAA